MPSDVREADHFELLRKNTLTFERSEGISYFFGDWNKSLNMLKFDLPGNLRQNTRILSSMRWDEVVNLLAARYKEKEVKTFICFDIYFQHGILICSFGPRKNQEKPTQTKRFAFQSRKSE